MKQTIVVNAALALPPGKLAAQVAHASLAAFLEASDAERQKWLDDGMTKIVLSCVDDSALQVIHEAARHANLPVALISDAGHTVLQPGTRTCVGIGPAAAVTIDRITGALPLLK